MKIKNIEEDSEYFYFKGYASTFNDVDLGNDIVISKPYNIRDLSLSIRETLS